MTSPATHDKLASTLKRQAYFGLQPSQVTLFQCSTAPPAVAGVSHRLSAAIRSGLFAIEAL
jgi:hypothetical protein